MAACACSTGLFQLQVLPKAAPTSSSVSSQLKPERVTQAKEVQCAALPSSTDCVCESRNHGGAKRTSVGYPVVKKSVKLNSLRLHGTGRTHARVQDTVENDIYDRSESASSPRGKERSRGWQSTHGNERRKVQVITDNGFVDLEEQLGISKNTKGRSRRGNSRRNGSSSRGFEEEEERLYLDGYELISVAEFDDSLDFGFGRNSFYSADELQMRQAAASPLEINKFLAEKGNSKERSNNPTTTVLDSPLPSSTDVQDYERVATRSVATDRGSKITEEADSIAKNLERQMLMERIGNSENGSISSSSNGTSIAVRMRKNVPAKLSKPLKSGEEALLNSKGFRDARGSVTRNASQVTTDVKEMEDLEDLEAVQFIHQGTVEWDIKDKLRNVRRQMSSGDTAGARKVLQKLLKRHPDDATVMVHMGQLEKKEGDTVAAGAYYGKAVAILREKGDYGVDYVKTLQGWGSLEAEARNSSRARSLFQECVRVSGKTAMGGAKELVEAGVYGLHGWAMLEQKLGNWSEARELLQRAADIQPGNAVVHQTRALLEAQAHNYASARHHFRLGVTSAPEDVKCWQAWALFEASQGKPGKMRQLFQKALEVEPNNVHSLQAWAHQEALLDTESSRNRARKLYQRCVEVNPENVHSWQAWAKLEHVAGNLTGARVLFERGLGANPRSIPCLQAYAHMERLSGCFESAKKLLLVAFSLEPENPAVLMELALTEEAMGDSVKAEEYFKKAGIADRLKSRTKRKIFESRKAAPKVKVPLKSRIDVTQKTSSGSQSTAPVRRRQVSAATKAGVR